MPGTGATYWDTKSDKAHVVSLPTEPIAQLQVDEHRALLKTMKEATTVL